MEDIKKLDEAEAKKKAEKKKKQIKKEGKANKKASKPKSKVIKNVKATPANKVQGKGRKKLNKKWCKSSDNWMIRIC